MIVPSHKYVLRGFADMNGINEAIRKLSDVSKEELRQHSKKTLKDCIIGTSLFGIFYSEKFAQRYYNQIVARRMLKKGTRDRDTILYAQ